MPSGIDNFLRRLHRRWIIWRAIEHAGVGLLGGCVVALLLGAVLLFRGEPALTLAAGLPLFGAAVGLTIGLIRRPSILDAAVEADRQLRLADLLGTALSIRRGLTVRADLLDENW